MSGKKGSDHAHEAGPAPGRPETGDHDSGEETARRSRRAVLISFGLGAGAVGVGTVASLVTASGRSGRSAPRPGAPAVLSARNAPRQLKMVTTWPKNFPGLGTGAVRFARRIEEMSGGAIAVTVYAAGELVPALQAFDAVSQGKADMYHAAEYYWQGRSLAFNFFAAVPMGLLARELNAWVHFGGGQELWDELAARFSIKPMLAGNTGPQMGGWFKKPIRSLADFQGLRMRIPGLGGEVVKRMGGTPVTKAGGELFQALDQGNIDATEWVGPWNDMAFALHTIADYYYYPGFHEPGTGLSCGINRKLWDSLDPAEQAVIRSAAAAETMVMHAEFEHENALALQRLLKIPRITIAPFPEDVQAAMARLSAAVLEEVAERDPFTRRVYESFLSARSRSMAWGRISEEAFAHARRLATDTAEG